MRDLVGLGMCNDRFQVSHGAQRWHGLQLCSNRNSDQIIKEICYHLFNQTKKTYRLVMRDLVGLGMCNDRFKFLMVHSGGMDFNLQFFGGFNGGAVGAGSNWGRGGSLGGGLALRV